MIIKNYSITNKYISIKSDYIKIPDTGITIIKGENGAGKSTFLKDIIFGVHDIEFSTDTYNELYKKNRGNLFFYVSQIIPRPEISVKDYLNISTRERSQNILELLNEFDLNPEILHNKIHQLSGGERVKLNLILAIEKKCPYIILDEPTNNLDNKTVNMLLSKIKEMGTYLSIIISTHDDRIFNIANMTLIIENGIIKSTDSEVSKSACHKKIEISTKTQNKDFTKFISKYLTKNKYHLLLRIVVICFLVLLTILTNLYFNNFYAVKESTAPNSIIAYLADEAYSDLNEKYAKSNNLVIPDSSHHKMINYSDLPKIASQKSINTIYLLDEIISDNVDELTSSYSKERNSSSTFITIPELITNNYMDIIGMSDDFALKSGKYPKDNAKEIAISAGRAKKICTDNSWDKCIGKQIAIDGKNYTIVGVTLGNLSLVSYGENYDNLFYKYNPKDYESFAKGNIAFKKEMEFVNTFEINDIIISVTPGKEEKVLNKLIEEFPANNYYSYEFENNVRHRHNKMILGIFLICNVLFITSLLILLNIILKNSIKNDIELLHFCNCYYLDLKMIRTSFIRIAMIYMLLFVLITLLILCKVLQISIPIEFGILIINAFVILCFIFIKYHREINKIQA